MCLWPQNGSLSGRDLTFVSRAEAWFPNAVGAKHMKGYVFITAAPGRSTDVVNALRRINGVRSADICWGLPDIVALVEAADGPALQDLVLCEIQKTAGVTQTDTHIVFG